MSTPTSARNNSPESDDTEGKRSFLFVAEALLGFLAFEATVTAGATPTLRREDGGEDADNAAGVDVGVGEDVGVVVVGVAGVGDVVAAVAVAFLGFNAKGFEVRT